MEQLTAFVLGVFIVTLVIGFVSMFRASKTVKANKESIDDLHNKIDELRQLRQWVTQMNNDTHSSISRVEEDISSEVDTIHRIIDSRVDKLDARFQQQIDDLARELDACINTGKISN
tara:strand:+ start:5053 stop:5403 length:351 start_codon:yes stop_codon:yes gene_type:complete